jgi:hypothetical protein
VREELGVGIHGEDANGDLVFSGEGVEVRRRQGSGNGLGVLGGIGGEVKAEVAGLLVEEGRVGAVFLGEGVSVVIGGEPRLALLAWGGGVRGVGKQEPGNSCHHERSQEAEAPAKKPETATFLGLGGSQGGSRTVNRRGMEVISARPAGLVGSVVLRVAVGAEDPALRLRAGRLHGTKAGILFDQMGSGTRSGEGLPLGRGVTEGAIMIHEGSRGGFVQRGGAGPAV